MKQLLLVFAISSNLLLSAQSARMPHDYSAERKRLHMAELKTRALLQPSNINRSNQGSRSSSIIWQPLCGSMNVYGMLIAGQHPLQFHSNLNAISFIHRKSDTYTCSPTLPIAAESGVIVAEISTNNGLSFDSTCLWANANEWGRYPQGAIYSPASNTNIAFAQIVGSGVTVNSAGFSGTWYASKSLASFNTTASAVPNAQQAYSFIQGPYSAAMPRHGWMNQGFTITDDGLAHALGVLGDDLSNTTSLRGYAVLTGSFNGQTFNWMIDSLIPNAEKKSDSISLQISEAKMAWNNAGTVGYIVGTGTFKNAQLSNRSYQPIIYKIDKTLSAAATWTLLPALDFNVQYNMVTQHLEKTPVTWPAVTGSVVALPFVSEFDITVDSLNRLHMAVLFMNGYSDHPDSLQFYSTYSTSINPTEFYRWKHIPNYHPYIYDFISQNNNYFEVLLIDSMSSESPGTATGDPGYLDNPWDADEDGLKIPMDARLQLSRSRDGKIILFTWAESDTLFTNNQFKYNNLPDVKIRAMQLAEDCASLLDLGQEYNATRSENEVRTRGTLHYASPVASNYTFNNGPSWNNYTVTINLPLTVTNSNPYSQLTNNQTWFSNHEFKVRFANYNGWDPLFLCTGLEEHGWKESGFSLFPNPAKEKVLIKLDQTSSSSIKIQILDIAGKILHSENVNSTEMEQELNLAGITPGIYFVLLSSEGITQTKKLVIE